MIRYHNPRVEGVLADTFQDQASAFAELAELEQSPGTALEVIGAYSKFLHRSIVLCWGSKELQQRMNDVLMGIGHEPLPRGVAQALMIISNDHATKFGF